MIDLRRRGIGLAGRRSALGALLAALAVMASPQPAVAATGDEVEALLAQPCPDRVVHSQRNYSSAELEAAADGRFVVFRGFPEVRLVPPVDWTQNPFRDRSWAHYLQTLGWLDPLLHDHLANGNDAALAAARDLVLDWIAANPRGAGNIAEEAWKDKSSGDRAGYLGYVARAAVCEGLLSEAEASTMIDSIRAHLTFLLEPANHPRRDRG